MILIINICSKKLHFFEFVSPIENILEGNEEFKTIHYNNLKNENLEKVDKVIICGTSLQDNQFLEDLGKFSWIKSLDKPLLGICGGMQLIALVFGGKLKNQTEIGYYSENFKRNFLSLQGEQEVYHLHNNYITLPKDFESYTDNKIPQAIKHKTKSFYGTLFHPEVRNKILIENFSKINR